MCRIEVAVPTRGQSLSPIQLDDPQIKCGGEPFCLVKELARTLDVLLDFQETPAGIRQLPAPYWIIIGRAAQRLGLQYRGPNASRIVLSLCDPGEVMASQSCQRVKSKRLGLIDGIAEFILQLRTNEFRSERRKGLDPQ
jgi:hypothetical protein